MRISPDGKTTREVSSTSALACAFSADGKTIGSLGSEYRPASLLSPALRLSLSPDGKSLTYSTVKSTSSLWLMEGLDTVALP